jgi:hypothetical protein
MRLVDKDLDLAKAISESLKVHGKNELAKNKKSTINATAKLFEAKVEVLVK